jgi:hypothetical protein
MTWQDYPMRRLLSDEALEASSVVANCAMNRQRQLVGVNSYNRELGFNPLDWIRARAERLSAAGGPRRVTWLDLCCGTGRPLVQAAEYLDATGADGRVDLVGVDLVDYFDPPPHPPSSGSWQPRSPRGRHGTRSTSSRVCTGCTTWATSLAFLLARQVGSPMAGYSSPISIWVRSACRTVARRDGHSPLPFELPESGTTRAAEG